MLIIFYIMFVFGLLYTALSSCCCSCVCSCIAIVHEWHGERAMVFVLMICGTSALARCLWYWINVCVVSYSSFSVFFVLLFACLHMFVLRVCVIALRIATILLHIHRLFSHHHIDIVGPFMQRRGKEIEDMFCIFFTFTPNNCYLSEKLHLAIEQYLWYRKKGTSLQMHKP